MEAHSMPAADPDRLRAALDARELFPFPDVTPLAGRAAPAEELDAAAAAALADAIAAFSGSRRAAGAPARVAATRSLRSDVSRLLARVASELRGSASPNTAPSTLRRAGGWRNG
jgi:hypothetical protein